MIYSIFLFSILGLSQTDSNYLESNLILEANTYPNFSQLKKLNDKLDLSTPSNQIQTYSHNFISNAWIKILTIDPSIYYNHFLINNSGRILISYNFDVKFPTEKLPNECNTIYNLISQESKNEVYLNDNYIGSGNHVNFRTNEKNVKITANFIPTIKYRIDHFKLKKRCSTCGKTCKFIYSEELTDSFVLSDTFIAKVQEDNLNFSIINPITYFNTTSFNYKSSNYSKISLNFDNSNLSLNNYIFKAKKLPSNAFYLIAKEQKSVKLFNSVIINKSIIIPKSNKCEIKINNFFHLKKLNCNFNNSKELKDNSKKINPIFLLIFILIIGGIITWNVA